MSNLTKRQLSASLQKLLVQMPLDKITIQDLVNEAQVSRKTFYYHFRDIYDLLEWTMVEEGRKLLGNRVEGDSWQVSLRNTFLYFEENKKMILHIYRSLQKGSDLMQRHVSSLILPMMEEYFDRQPGHQLVAEQDRRFLLGLYSYGIVDLFLHWIGEGMQPEANQMTDRIIRLFRGSMEGFIQRYNEG